MSTLSVVRLTEPDLLVQGHLCTLGIAGEINSIRDITVDLGDFVDTYDMPFRGAPDIREERSSMV